MPKELTEKAALEITRDLWDWLAENPSNFRCEWPKWANVRKKHHIPYATDCALCYYSLSQSGKRCRPCEPCPLYGKWTKSPKSTCEYLASPYYKWNRDLNPSKHAKQVANLCRTRLKQLDKEGKQ